MKHSNRTISFASLASLILLLGMPSGSNAQERRMLEEPKQNGTPGAAPLAVPKPLACTGPITKVIDIAYENVKVTSALFGSNPGGGQGGQFDKIPVLSTKVTLAKGTCLNAHFSAIVGSGQLYGRSRLALFQVTLTPASGGPRHMVGHYETPYGIASPAVALQAENDVDMLGANFFQMVGTGVHEVPAGTYSVDVWWAGAPPGSPAPTGAIGAAFVLKLYLR